MTPWRPAASALGPPVSPAAPGSLDEAAAPADGAPEDGAPDEIAAGDAPVEPVAPLVAAPAGSVRRTRGARLGMRGEADAPADALDGEASTFCAPPTGAASAGRSTS